MWNVVRVQFPNQTSHQEMITERRDSLLYIVDADIDAV
jgi:hypothetical protein